MSVLNWEPDDDFGNRSNLFLPDFHLKTAIRKDKRRFLLLKIIENGATCPKYLFESISLIKQLGLTENNVSIDSEQLYPYIWDLSRAERSTKKTSLLRKFTQSNQVAKIISIPFINHLLSFSTTKDNNKQTLSNFTIINSYEPSTLVLYSFLLKTYLNEIKCHMAINLRDKNRNIHTRALDSKQELRVYYNDYFCSFFIEEMHHIFDYDQILMLSDTMTSRYLTFLVTDLYSLVLPNHLPTPGMIYDIYDWGGKLIEKFGNKSYDGLKQFEAICTAVCLNKFDTLLAAKRFYEGLVKEYEDEPWKDDIDNLSKILHNLCNTPQQLMEIFGVYRHFGHPTIDEELGCKKMKEHTRAKVDVDDHTMMKISGAFKLGFIKSFISKKNRWPKVKLTKTKHPELTKVVKYKLLNFDDYTTSIPLYYWHYIEFEKEFDFDYYYDFTELLKDTSIAPYKKEWRTLYDPSILEQPVKISHKHSRRVLVEILSRKIIEIEEICKIIMSGNVPEEWKIIVLHAKERELAIQSRLFAMLVLEMRLYFGVTESNLKQIFKFVSGQTMTMGEGELQHHLLNISNLDSSHSYVPIIISVDYKKWNNYQRKENNFYIFEAVEQLFGTPGLYNYTHQFFQECSYVLGSRDNPPKYLLKRDLLISQHKTYFDEEIKHLSTKEYKDISSGAIIEDENTWIGQSGGCEGQRQKGWTLTTNSMLRAIEYEIGIKSMITGQGDNQVIAIYLPIRIPGVDKERYCNDYQHILNNDINQYLTLLEKYSKSTGIQIKPQESWASSTLFNYGKEILYKSCFLSNIIKKVSRAYHTVSESYPSLATRIASVHTACHAASSKGLDPIVPYYISVVEISIMLLLEVNYSPTLRDKLSALCTNRRIKIDVNMLLFIHMFSKDFGGYPVMCPLDYVYRGHPDPITSQLSWLKILANNDVGLSKLILCWLVSLEGISQNIDMTALVQDPVALNFKTPPNYANLIKNKLLQKLTYITKNKDLKLLLSLGQTGEKVKGTLIDYLSTINECSPRIFNEIFRNSPEGARLNFILTFTDMRTLKGLFNLEEQTQLSRQFTNCDINQFSHILDTFTKIRSISFSGVFYNRTGFTLKSFPGVKCTTTLAQLLRNASWGKIITHVTTPHPSEQFQLMLLPSTPSNAGVQISQLEHIVYIYAPPERVYFNSIFLSRGKIEPYEGSTTKEKKSQKLIPMSKINRSVQSAQSLFRLLCWVCREDSNVGELIKSLILSRANIDLDMLKFISGVNYGGSVHHRFNDVITKHTSRPNIRINLFSSIYMSSDCMGKYSRGLENWTMHYQGAYLHALTSISTAIISKDLDSNKRHVINQNINCEECCIKLIDNYLESDVKPPVIKPITTCKLLYSGCTDIVKTLDWEALNFVKTDYPKEIDPDIKSKRSIAIAYCIMSIGNCSLKPLVITPLSFESDSRILNSISIAAFLQIGVKSVVDDFSLLWFYDHLLGIIQLGLTYNFNLEKSIQLSILNISKTYWSHLKNIFLIPEIQKQLTNDLMITPKNPLSHLRDDTFDNQLGNYMIHHIVNSVNAHTIKKLKLYCITKGISFMRLVLIWVSALAFCTYDGDLRKLFNVMSECQRAVYDSVNADSIDMKSFFLRYLCLRKYYQDLPNILEEPYTLNLSLIGPEPWCKSQSVRITDLPSNTRRMPVTNVRKVDIKALSEIKGILRHEISNSVEMNVPLGVITPTVRDLTSLRSFHTNRVTPKYDYHQYRVTGLHSSSHYKFLDIILTHLPSQNFQQCICLADGSGGVSNLMFKIFSPIRLIYNSYFNLDKCPIQRLPGITPPEISDDDLIKVEGIQNSLYYGGDLREEKTANTICSMIDSCMCTIITCDLELGFDIPVEYQISCFKSIITVLKQASPGTWLVYKSYLTNVPLFYFFINLLLTVTDNVKIARSLYSDPRGHEVFVIIQTGQGIISKEISFDIKSYQEYTAGSFVYEDLCNFSETMKLTNVSMGMEQSIAVNKILITRFGYTPNLKNSLIDVSKGLISDYKDKLDLLYQVQNSIDVLIGHITKRIISYGQVQKRNQLSKVERQIHGPYSGENKDVSNLSHHIYTLILLKDHLNGVDSQDLDFNKGFCIKKKKTVIYNYIYNEWEWSIFIGRQFYKIIGGLVNDHR